MSTFAERRTVIPPLPPSTPRLRLGPIQTRGAPLDGGWWPRSTDPVAELPGLVLAIDHRRGPITRVMLGRTGWDSHPARIAVAGRVIRFGWFASQPVGLVTGLCADRTRIDLLLVPPDTDEAVATAAMARAAEPGTKLWPKLRTSDILAAALADLSKAAEMAGQSESGSDGDARPHADPDQRPAQPVPRSPSNSRLARSTQAAAQTITPPT
jgi:uncharacterized protein DUF5994